MPVHESEMIDLDSIIGIYPICNTGSVLVHKIDYGEERVMASINGQSVGWYDITESEIDGEMVQGFWLCALFVPLCEILRFYEYT